MKSLLLKLIKALIVVDLIVIVFSLIFFDINMLYNTQVGFITATLVMLGSLNGYRRMVEARVEHQIITMDDSRDVIDKMEDPYDLYSEEVNEDPEVDIREAVKEEKSRMKKNRRSLFQVVKDTRAALSIYRLGAYILLILGFLYLHRHEMLHVPSYLLSMMLSTAVIIAILMKEK